MTVKELIEKINNNKNKMLKEAQLREIVSKTLNVQKYLGIKQKKELVESIVNECLLYEDGIFKFDDIEKYICFTMKTIEAYTNLELSRDIEEDYDALCEAGLLNIIIGTFAGEYENIRLLLQMKSDYILNNNNIEIQVGKFLNDLLEKIDDVTSVASEKIGKFDMSKLPFSTGDLNKLMNFINSQKNK